MKIDFTMRRAIEKKKIEAQKRRNAVKAPLL